MLRSLVRAARRAPASTPSCLLADDRRAGPRDAADGELRFLLLKPDDVPTYVEYGAADLGVSGRDMLLERRYDLYQPLDLGIGRCRMVVAAPRGVDGAGRSARRHQVPAHHRRALRARGVQAEIIYVQGSVELAPLVGLADLIVDLVETGATLRENDLEERELIAPISSVLVANRAQYKLRHEAVRPLVERLRSVVAP